MSSKYVHFTHHLCVAAGSRSNPYERMRIDDGSNLGDGSNTYDRRWPHDRDPETRGILSSCRLRGRAPSLTTDPSAVTCRNCIEGLRLNGRAQWLADRRAPRWNNADATWVSDRDLTARAWLLCCRHDDLPRPKGLTLAAVEQFDREQTALRVERDFRLAIIGFDTSEMVRGTLERAVEKLAEFRDVLQPAIDELTMIGDVLEEVDRIRARAVEKFERAVAGIRSGEIAVVSRALSRRAPSSGVTGSVSPALRVWPIVWSRV